MKGKWSGELGKLYTDYIAAFDEKYHDIGFFGARDGKAVKQIIVQTIGYFKKQNQEPTMEALLNFWRAFVANLHKTWGHNKDLATINGKYTTLIQDIKTKNNGKEQRKGQSRGEELNPFYGITDPEELRTIFDRESGRG